MPEFNNILSPIDMFGGLVTPRLQGERLEDYRARVVQVASVLAHRDLADPQWRTKREIELGGHVGMEVVLEDGTGDDELQAQARSLLMTWNRLSDLEGPFVWPEPIASGKPPLYNRVNVRRGGVAGPQDLAPAYEPATGKHFARPGMVAYDEELAYVAGRFESASLHLPANTTETVVIPYQIRTEHPHQIVAVDEETIQLVASNHTHTLTLRNSGLEQTAFSGTGSHQHVLVPLNYDGPCFLMAAADDPVINVDDGFDRDVSGSLLQPLDVVAAAQVHLGGSYVTTGTSDGVDSHVHNSWVSPHDWWQGEFVIGGEDDAGNFHTHVVNNWVVAAAEDGHTHSLSAPTVPEYRPLVPLITGAESQVYETNASNNPFIAEVTTEFGWTKVSSVHGLGERLVMAHPQPSLLEIPAERVAGPFPPDGALLGLGPAEPASKIHLAEAFPDHAGHMLYITIRSEDSRTGGVPKRPVRVSIVTESGDSVEYESATDHRAVCRVGIELPPIGGDDTPLAAAGRRSIVTLTAELLDAPTSEGGTTLDTYTRELDLQRLRPGTFGYGILYGVARPASVIG